jgi:ankyrin repeat protein
MRAAESGQIDMVKFLIRKGADICARTESDETALMLAVRGGHINIVKLLIEKSADVEVKDHFETWIRIPGGGLYKKKKTYIDACNNEGETALIYALKEVQSEKLERKQAEIVKLLIEEGANVNAKDHWGRPALTILLQFENSRFVKDISLVKLFVEYGADVNAVGGYGETALKEAARAGYWDVCKYLVDYGADVNFVGYLGLAGKAIDYARNPDVIDLLKYKMKENTNKK